MIEEHGFLLADWREDAPKAGVAALANPKARKVDADGPPSVLLKGISGLLGRY
jgi:hypothetical protein